MPGAVVVTAISAEGGAALATAPLANAFDWQAALGLREPWRLWTSAWVHWSAAHLFVNVVGAVVVAFVGWRARLPRAAAVAWFLAWPTTQLRWPPSAPTASPRRCRTTADCRACCMPASSCWGCRSHGRPRAPASGRPLAPVRADTGFVATRASAIEPSRITEGPWAMTEMGTHTAVPASTLEQPPPVVPGGRPLRERWIGVAIVVGTLVKVRVRGAVGSGAAAQRDAGNVGGARRPRLRRRGRTAGLVRGAPARSTSAAERARPPAARPLSPRRHGS